MSAIPADIGPVTFTTATGWISFRPVGPLRFLGPCAHTRLNAGQWAAASHIYSARFLIGFNVGDDPVWTLDDVADEVEAVRCAQSRPPDATFIAQRGIYTYTNGALRTLEDGAQVVIIAPRGTDLDAFKAEMAGVAEWIAARLVQEFVRAEIQGNGVLLFETQFTAGAGIAARPWPERGLDVSRKPV